jgi:hypothetical protein
VAHPPEKLGLNAEVASAAEAGTENKPAIAAVNRCATQKQDQNRVFQQSVKPYSK